MSKRVFVLLALVAGLVLVGCAPYRSSRSCEEIRAANLRALIQDTMSVEQVAKRITEAFDVAAKDLKITTSPDNPNVDLSWKAHGVQYEILMRSPKVLWASMTYESNAPSADQVIECLGVPDTYWAFYYPRPQPIFRVATLNLYFPALGVTCRGDKRGLGDRPPRFDGGVPIVTFDFVPLGPTDEVMTQLIGKGNEERIRREMKPWPEDWREVEVHYGYP